MALALNAVALAVGALKFQEPEAKSNFKLVLISARVGAGQYVAYFDRYTLSAA